MRSLIKLGFKSIFGVIIIAAFVYFAVTYVLPRLEEKEKTDWKTDNNYYQVTRIVDGDTFEIDMDGRKEKVRMLAIDTPEKWESSKLNKDAERTNNDKKTIKKLGELSHKYTKKLIEGKKVKLVPDPVNDDKDRYGRLLRYVYLDDGTFVNLKIVEEGYANAYTRFPLSRKDEFVNAEKKARENKKGLWGDIEGLKYMGEK